MKDSLFTCRSHSKNSLSKEGAAQVGTMPEKIMSWAELQLLGRIVYTSRVLIIVDRFVGKSTAHTHTHRRNIVHAAKSSEIPYTTNIKNQLV